MKTGWKIGVLGLLFLWSGCKENRVERLLTEAEACMEAAADSAWRCLQQIDPETELRQGEWQARYGLLWTQARHKCHLPLGSDSLISRSVDYYRKHGERKRLAKALLYKGIVHRQNKQAVEAAEAFAEAELCYEGVEDNQYNKALLCTHYAWVLTEQQMYDGALKYFKKAYEYDAHGDSLHYAMLGCADIAMIYYLLQMPDSARYYYELGLTYEGRVKPKDFLKFQYSYAIFLVTENRFEEAERMMREYERVVTDSATVPHVHSGLATFYYQTKNYPRALEYARKVLACPDSSLRSTGYLHLYRIYKQMGETDVATCYHDTFRYYENDLTLRRQTARVAAVPHEMKNRDLEADNSRLWHWLLMALGSCALIMGAAWYGYRWLKRRHNARVANGWRLQGVITNQKKAISQLRENMDGMKKDYQEEVGKLKTQIKQMKEEMKRLTSPDPALAAEVKSYKKKLEETGKEIKRLVKQVEEKEHEMDIMQRIEYYSRRWGSRHSTSVDLLMQLKYGTGHSKYDFVEAEYAPLLLRLLKEEQPQLAVRMEEWKLPGKKKIICALLALGLDDRQMIKASTGLENSNSIRTYRNECLNMLKEFLRGEENSQSGINR